MSDLISREDHSVSNQPEFARVLNAFLAGKSKQTLKAYKLDLRLFLDFLKLETEEQLARRFHENGAGRSNLDALEYRDHLDKQGIAPRTINRRVASVKSFVKALNTVGILNWQLSVPRIKARVFKDTQGPGEDGFFKMIDAIGSEPASARKVRDLCILWLLFGLGLRRGELCALNMEDYDKAAQRLWIMGKGRKEKEPLTIPKALLPLLNQWLSCNFIQSVGSPLFVYIHRSGTIQDSRLTGESIRLIVKYYSDKAGIPTVRPHGLRHAAITAALDRSNGDVRKVQRFSRHKSIDMLQIYDDNRRDFGGEIADDLTRRPE